MISIFNYASSTDFLKAWVANKEASGNARGLKSRLARAMKVSPTMMTFFLKGEKILALEQAAELTEFLNLSESESDFLFLLIEYDRGGSVKLKNQLQRKIRQGQAEAKKLRSRVQPDKEITDEVRAIYYSTWLYTAVRNLSAIPGYQTSAAIAEHLRLPEDQIVQAVEFLAKNGLVNRNADQVTYGPKSIYLPAESPFVVRHHQNWRQRAFPTMDQREPEHLFFTCPMSLSTEAVQEIRKLLPTLVEQALKICGPSESEVAYCLNIDWFEI
jgi:uncharacterized protein (TIGR02147 family)